MTTRPAEKIKRGLQDAIERKISRAIFVNAAIRVICPRCDTEHKAGGRRHRWCRSCGLEFHYIDGDGENVESKRNSAAPG